MKNSNDTLWDRTRDLPICSAVVTSSTVSLSQYKCDRHNMAEGLYMKVTEIFKKQKSTLEPPGSKTHKGQHL